MKNILPAALLSAGLLCASSFAQSTPSTQNPSAPPSQPEAQPAPNTPPQPAAQPQPQPETQPAPASTNQAAAQRRIAPGSVIPVQLTKTIDAKKAKPGDEVMAKVTMDMKTNSGELIVPKDTKVMGHVTEAQARNKEQKESQVGIAFDRAVLKDGEMRLPMSIQAVIAPPANNANNSGADQAAPASTGSPSASPAGAGRSGSMGGSGQTQPSNPTPSAVGTDTASSSSEGNARPQITGNTQGVVGISNLKLEPAPTGAQGSVLTSDKNNVKVESGTMLLLRVNQ